MRTSEIANYAEVERALIGPALRVLRGRNSALDALFYDIGCLSVRERGLLSADTNPEGSILLIMPSGDTSSADGLGVERFRTVAGFLAQAASRTSAVVLAGVGSSALGTAALARNVADTIGAPVAGIVSGHGVADLAGEALGGWFGFGAANRVRQQVDRTLDRFAPFLSALDETPGRGAAATAASTLSGHVEGAPDSEALVGLLTDTGFSPRLLVGHSKGCLSIANALFGLSEADPDRFNVVAASLAVATFGAVVHLPSGITHVGQFIGEVDWFGGMNSRRNVRHEVIPGAWHHLNTMLPAHLPVRGALEPFLQKVRTLDAAGPGNTATKSLLGPTSAPAKVRTARTGVPAETSPSEA